jgi:hypothetical protein
MRAIQNNIPSATSPHPEQQIRARGLRLKLTNYKMYAVFKDFVSSWNCCFSLLEAREQRNMESHVHGQLIRFEPRLQVRLVLLQQMNYVAACIEKCLRQHDILHKLPKRYIRESAL